MSAYMAAFGYELLAALEELLEEFEESEASGDRNATISSEHFTKLEALVARGTAQ